MYLVDNGEQVLSRVGTASSLPLPPVEDESKPAEKPTPASPLCFGTFAKVFGSGPIDNVVYRLSANIVKVLSQVRVCVAVEWRWAVSGLGCPVPPPPPRPGPLAYSSSRTPYVLSATLWYRVVVQVHPYLSLEQSALDAVVNFNCRVFTAVMKKAVGTCMKEGASLRCSCTCRESILFPISIPGWAHPLPRACCLRAARQDSLWPD